MLLVLCGKFSFNSINIYLNSFKLFSFPSCNIQMLSIFLYSPKLFRMIIKITWTESMILMTSIIYNVHTSSESQKISSVRAHIPIWTLNGTLINVILNKIKQCGIPNFMLFQSTLFLASISPFLNSQTSYNNIWVSFYKHNCLLVLATLRQK
jgi:hypothetical protein